MEKWEYDGDIWGYSGLNNQKLRYMGESIYIYIYIYCNTIHIIYIMLIQNINRRKFRS